MDVARRSKRTAQQHKNSTQNASDTSNAKSGQKRKNTLNSNARNQGFVCPFKDTQSQYVLRAWLAVRALHVSLLVSGPLLVI